MILGGLAKASGKTLATTAAVTAAGFFSSVITARILGPEGRGLLSAALLIATLAAGVSQFGLANSFIYHRGAGWRFGYEKLLAGSLLAICLLAAVLAAAGLGLSEYPELHGQLPLVAGLAGFTAAQTYLMTLSQLRAGLGFFNFMRFGLVFGNVLALLALLAFAGSIDYRDILHAQLLVAAILVPIGLLWARQVLVERVADGTRAEEEGRWRDLFRYGLNHHGTVFLGLVLLNFDKIVLLKMGTVVQYGYYALAFTTSRLIGALQEAISTALFARFAGKDVEHLSAGVRAAFRVTFLPMLLVAALGAALSPWLIVLLFGAAFAPMAAPFSVLLFECVVGGASWMLAQRFTAGGRPGMVFVRQLVSVLPIFAAIPFLPEHNIHLYLAGLMLMGAMLRLLVTFALFPLALKESVPEILPRMADLRALRLLFLRSRAA
jgi:O-antigen/teichoic acid export membrane protein